MCKDRTGGGKSLSFFSAGLIFFLLIGFIPSKEGFTASSQRVSSQSAPKQKEPARPTAEDLGRAKGLFDLGDYVAALEQNQRILSRSAKDDFRGQALFNIGLIYAYVGNPQRDLRKALQFFESVLKEYPHGPLTGETKVLIGVLQEEENLSRVIMKVKRENKELSQVVEKFKRKSEELSQMIEKSKQVDIDVEEKKKSKQEEKEK